MNVCLPYCFLQTSLAADESSSVIVTTSNKEKYRCLLPKEIDEQEKTKGSYYGCVSVCDLHRNRVC
jgi:hypothetical protein